MSYRWPTRPVKKYPLVFFLSKNGDINFVFIIIRFVIFCSVTKLPGFESQIQFLPPLSFLPLSHRYGLLQYHS